MQGAEIGANPFAILSFIVAPAILTNASSVLAMSTSNRLARAVDRARDLTRILDLREETPEDTPEIIRELDTAEDRALMLIRALRSFYTALGGFAASALLSLLGAVTVNVAPPPVITAVEWIAVLVGLLAVGALIHGSGLLVRETRLAVAILAERAALARQRRAVLEIE